MPASRTAAAAAVSRLFRPGALISSEGIFTYLHSMRLYRCAVWLTCRAGLPAVDQAEDGRHQEQGGARGEDQPTDYGTPQRLVLSGLDRHRQHADHHRE